MCKRLTFCACLWVDIFAFCSKEIKHCMKALHGHQLDICRFSEMYRCGLPQWGIAASLWRAVYSFGKRQAYLWIPTEPLWLTTQLDVIQSQYWGLCLVTRDGQLDPLYIYIVASSLVLHGIPECSNKCVFHFCAFFCELFLLLANPVQF